MKQEKAVVTASRIHRLEIRGRGISHVDRGNDVHGGSVAQELPRCMLACEVPRIARKPGPVGGQRTSSGRTERSLCRQGVESDARTILRGGYRVRRSRRQIAWLGPEREQACFLPRWPGRATTVPEESRSPISCPERNLSKAKERGPCELLNVRAIQPNSSNLRSLKIHIPSSRGSVLRIRFRESGKPVFTWLRLGSGFSKFSVGKKTSRHT